jgi:ABC-type branched-subunit amino acid transport system ATPase component
MDTILETEKLSKRFSGFEAVSDLNLRLRKGSICAFLGQNGTGQDYNSAHDFGNDAAESGLGTHL